MINQYTLKDMHMEKHPGSHFFDTDTLKFFGESMSSMTVLNTIVNVKDVMGDWHQCYVLSSRQSNAPGGPKRAYHYFDTNTLDNIYVPEDRHE